MEIKKIYIVSSYGGEWEDKWQKMECAFDTNEAAQDYIKKTESITEGLSDELFEEIESFLAEKEYEIQCKYYDPNTGDLYKDASEDEYDKETEEFERVKKYELIKEKFNIEQEAYDKKSFDRTYDFCNYMIEELDLYLGCE